MFRDCIFWPPPLGRVAQLEMSFSNTIIKERLFNPQTPDGYQRDRLLYSLKWKVIIVVVVDCVSDVSSSIVFAHHRPLLLRYCRRPVARREPASLAQRGLSF